MLAAFALAPVALVIQTFVTDHVDEPFPALTLPAFGAAPGDDDRAVTDVPSFEVTFADGSERAFDYERFVGETSVPQLFIVRRGFGIDGERAHDPDTVDWLRQRIADLAPDGDATEVTVVWVRSTYELRSGRLIDAEEHRSIEVDV